MLELWQRLWVDGGVDALVGRFQPRPIPVLR
jgi:hypothetical protein